MLSCRGSNSAFVLHLKISHFPQRLFLFASCYPTFYLSSQLCAGVIWGKAHLRLLHWVVFVASDYNCWRGKTQEEHLQLLWGGRGGGGRGTAHLATPQRAPGEHAHWAGGFPTDWALGSSRSQKVSLAHGHEWNSQVNKWRHRAWP